MKATSSDDLPDCPAPPSLSDQMPVWMKDFGDRLLQGLTDLDKRFSQLNNRLTSTDRHMQLFDRRMQLFEYGQRLRGHRNYAVVGPEPAEPRRPPKAAPPGNSACEHPSVWEPVWAPR